jgi:hypothetical protein
VNLTRAGYRKFCAYKTSMARKDPKNCNFRPGNPFGRCPDTLMNHADRLCLQQRINHRLLYSERSCSLPVRKENFTRASCACNRTRALRPPYTDDLSH